jgi:hypothetical protein
MQNAKWRMQNFESVILKSVGKGKPRNKQNTRTPKASRGKVWIFRLFRVYRGSKNSLGTLHHWEQGSRRPGRMQNAKLRKEQELPADDADDADSRR